MVHKLKELEDSHIIAELRQRVAALEVHIQELVTTDQIQENGICDGDQYGSLPLVDFLVL